MLILQMKYNTTSLLTCLIVLACSFYSESFLHAKTDEYWWVGDEYELWGDESSWRDGEIPDDTDAMARFYYHQSSIVVCIEDEYTVGYLISHDDYVKFHTYSQNGLINLERSDGKPVISTFSNASIAFDCAVSGDQGFIKTGANNLVIRGSCEGLHGGIEIRIGDIYAYTKHMLNDDVSLNIYDNCTYYLCNEDNGDQMGSLSGEGTLDLDDGGWIKVGADNKDSEFSGTLFGIGGFGKVGTGTLTLSGSGSDYTGTTTVSGGTLLLGNARVLEMSTVELASGLDLNGFNPTFGTITGSNDYDLGIDTVLTVGGNNKSTTYSGDLSGTGASLIKKGSGTLTLSGANSYTGGIVIKAGSVSVSNDSNLGLSSGPGITLDGGVLQITGTSMTSTDHTISLSDAGGGFDIVESSNTFEVDQDLGGSGGITKTGAGVLRLSGDNNYTGMTSIMEGVVQLTGRMNDDAHISVASGAQLWAGIGNSLGANTEVSLSEGATLEMEGSEGFGAISGAGNVETEVYNISLGADYDTTFSGCISGYGVLSKHGSGTLTLSGSNTLSNGIKLQGGTLSVSQSDNLGPTTGAGITFDGGMLQVTGSEFGSLDHIVNWSDGGGGFDITESGHAFTIDAVLGGTGGLTKQGAGTLVLSGSNTYSGLTEVEAGTLRLTGNMNDDGDIVVANGATLRAGYSNSLGANTQVDLNEGSTLIIEGGEEFGSVVGSGNLQNNGYNVYLSPSEDTAFSGVISGGGKLTKRGSASMTLAGANTYSGNTTIQEGTLVAANNSALGTGEVSVQGGSFLVDEDVTISNFVDLVSGTVQGFGTIENDFSFGSATIATLAPGNSPGILTIDGDYTQGEFGILSIELGGTIRGDEYDALVVTGVMDLAGDLNVGFINGFEATVGNAFDLLDWGSITSGSEFSNIYLPELSDSNLSWDISQLYVSGAISCVPEPQIYSLLIAVSAGLLVCIRRRRK